MAWYWWALLAFILVLVALKRHASSTALVQSTLPNGLRVSTFSSNTVEANILYHELFEERPYLKHGISLRQNGLVLDIGANMGFFSLHLLSHPELKSLGIRVVAFEPIPSLFNLIRLNLANRSSRSTVVLDANTLERKEVIESSSSSTSSSSSSSEAWQVALINVGLADSNADVDFLFNPSQTVSTGAAHIDVKKAYTSRSVEKSVHALLADGVRIKTVPLAFYKAFMFLLSVPLVRHLVLICMYLLLLLDKYVKRISTTKVQCKLRRLSEIIDKLALDDIDLVKIDVEGAEAEVLRGMSDEHLKRVKQFVIEVHNIDKNIDEMKTRLEKAGFQTKLDQEDWELHRLMGIQTLYATRP